ncbi:MAG TPA: AmmeMemoRadiSam system radical SAM enzyme [Candidatus Hydrogenedentes bacterium]|nr:AmmeMemoRadiSam system radical SAM enzyme [Candidatus Hydrogenedentota bacterium]
MDEIMATVFRKLLSGQAVAAASALTGAEADGAVRCLACGHRCLVRPGRRGVCRVRHNEGGVLKVPFGYVAGLAADPVEKKPFYHVKPGGVALSFGMLGCNLRCPFCQNWNTSQILRDPAAGAAVHACTAREIAEAGERAGAALMVSTYNEPLITPEWARAVFEEAKPRGMLCGFVSNGFATPEALDFLLPVLDVFKVDLKCFDARRYGELGGRLPEVMDTLARLAAAGVWVEVVTLLVPGFNDDAEELRRLAAFLCGLSPDIPWHVTAFTPQYRKRRVRPTTAEDLTKAWDIGKSAGLRHVYTGNLPRQTGARENTFCAECGAALVERSGFRVCALRVSEGRCPECGRAVPGRW